MLDPRDDQASGLRRSMSRRGGQVLALVGAGEHPQLAGRLARALADGGTVLTLVSDFEGLLEDLARAAPRARLSSIHSRQSGDVVHGLATVAGRGALTLFAVDDERLARGPALPASEAVVLACADTEALATAYTRIKALVGHGSVNDVCTLFGPGGAPARRGHERLERMAERFLGVGLAFGGAAPDPARAGAWRRLADGVADWAFSSKGGAGWRPH